MMDPRISKYREAVEALAKGEFSAGPPIEGGGDEIGKLGLALAELRRTLEQKENEDRKLAGITEEINSGLILDEVLNHVYNSFRSIIPYERIGFSLLEEDGKIVRSHWVRSESPVVLLSAGYKAPLEGSSLQEIILTGRPRILNDLAEYLRNHPTICVFL